jgi:ribosomal protein L11 methyltransferase
MRNWPAIEIRQPDPEDLAAALLLDFNLAAVEGPRFFFHNTGDRDRALEALRAQLPQFGGRAVDVDDEDWAARSQQMLQSVRVGALIVSPPWDAGDGAIIIKPSTGFGTGHHATTRLCLAALQQIDLTGRTVIDVGTGSGILALAARRLGASGVLALDDDADAIAAAEENVRANSATRIALEVADFRAATIGQFDVVIANLTGGLLIASAERLQSFAVPGGWLVLSGFLNEETGDVLKAFATCRLHARTSEDEWVCARLKTPATS